jgi:RNA polymerase sigma-70 factor, ECF subfamily
VDAAERERLQSAMAALARGERSAFRPVFDTLWPLLRQFCRRALLDDLLAEDAAQAALMKLFLHATDFRPEGDVVAWAVGIAAFECRSLRNRRARRAEESPPSELATVALGQPSPEEVAIHADLGAALREIVQSLRPGDRETLEQVLGPAPPARRDATSRKRLQRALERLRAAWRLTHGSDD